jgi:hypothetical protein
MQPARVTKVIGYWATQTIQIKNTVTRLAKKRNQSL